MAKLNVALCITDLEVGGAERCVAKLASRLDRERFEPVVYCLGPQPKGDTSCVTELQAAGIDVRFLGARRSWEILGVVWRLKRLLVRQQPSLVQTFLFHANLVGRLAARWAGVPWVVSGIRVAERRSRWHLWADRLSQRLVDRHVCVSSAVARFSETEARLPANRLVVIPNGVEIQNYPAAQPLDLTCLGIPAGHRVVSYVGRLDRQKGVHWLAETAGRWLEQLPDCHLLLVGKGPERRKLERLCVHEGTSARIHFAGWRNDVPEILAASDLLVLPSAWEGMPNVVLEAMASGLPVMATDVEGVRELLGPLADQQTVRRGDAQLLVQKIVNLMSNPDIASKLGAENRRRAEQNFGLDKMVAAYENLWDTLAGHAAKV